MKGLKPFLSQAGQNHPFCYFNLSNAILLVKGEPLGGKGLMLETYQLVYVHQPIVFIFRFVLGIINVTLVHASMWCCINGYPAMGNNGFGNSNDKGRNLVPGPTKEKQ